MPKSPLTPERLAELRAIAESDKAPPRPWKVGIPEGGFELAHIAVNNFDALLNAYMKSQGELRDLLKAAYCEGIDDGQVGWCNENERHISNEELWDLSYTKMHIPDK